MDFDPPHWLEIARNNPVLTLLVIGMVGGAGAAQFVKMAFLAFGNTSSITVARYRFTMYMLAFLFTACITHALWNEEIPPPYHGLDDTASIVNGFICPYAYRAIKALVAWKMPKFAEGWGDNGHTPWKDAK